MSTDDVSDVDFENDARAIFIGDVLTQFLFDGDADDFDGDATRMSVVTLTSALTRNQLVSLIASSSLQLRSLGLLTIKICRSSFLVYRLLS